MKVVLTIAGSDSSGGAGIQADLKTFEAHGVFGASVVTVLTAQNTKGVSDIFRVDAEFVKKQLEAVLSDFDVAAIKIGMLFSTDIIKVVHETLIDFDKQVVLDPVFISKANSLLLREEAVEALKEMFQIATLITPNIYEAYRLFGYSAGDSDSLKNVKNAPCPVLVKNHITERGGELCSVDILYDKTDKFVFDTPFSPSRSTHGTGCSLSSAIAANLALGLSLNDAIAAAKRFVYHAITSAPNIGGGSGPIAHKIGYESMLSHQGVEKCK